MSKRQPNTQDIAWFLDLSAKGKLDLDPPYQRRSVWTPKDRAFFLDSVLRDFPTVPIFLHKSRDEHGDTTYHVVDGKQRLETILMFSKDEIRAPKDFGNSEINNKQFSKLSKAVKERFWDYILTVEMVDASEGALVNEIFDRLNRNSRSLTRQELRHARFDGEFTTKMETEADDPFWAQLAISTRPRARRMRDVEFMAELWLLAAHGPMATTADALDDYFAAYDDEIPDYDIVKTRFDYAKTRIAKIDTEYPIAQSRFNNFADFYGLFGAILSIGRKRLASREVADHLRVFDRDLERAQTFLSSAVPESAGRRAKPPPQPLQDSITYLQAIRGASNDLKERTDRIAILTQRLFPEIAQGR